MNVCVNQHQEIKRIQDYIQFQLELKESSNQLFIMCFPRYKDWNATLMKSEVEFEDQRDKRKEEDC